MIAAGIIGFVLGFVACAIVVFVYVIVACDNEMVAQEPYEDAPLSNICKEKTT